MSAFLLDFGRMEYGKALGLQKELAARRARGEIPDSLILVEHEHVITLGRKTTPSNFRPQDIPVFEVERGGDATYHGPGQLVGYPIVLLADHDVRRHVRGMEEAIIRTAATFGVKGERLGGHPGIWADGKKLASIGVAVTDWVTYHGFALNVNTDLSYFDLIRPCGLDPSTMTSMQKIVGRPLPFEEVKAKFAREYSVVTGLALVHQRLVAPD
ncbi:MAG TPA: lipoyl(octanoyl) transferase LipB [Nitrososphaerales archaeon]|nr:lipoyl(octanoyl) transferase LipB [Nitrososphaerales archaeon]